MAAPACGLAAEIKRAPSVRRPNSDTARFRLRMAFFSSRSSYDWRLRLLSLRAVPNRLYCDTPATEFIKDNVRSAADDQFAKARLGSCATQVRMISQRLHNRDDARCQAFRSIRFIQSDVCANLPQTSSSQGRPDNLYRHSDSSSWFLPQTHLGGGTSWSVPQERSQAFISSCLM